MTEINLCFSIVLLAYILKVLNHVIINLFCKYIDENIHTKNEIEETNQEKQE